VFTLVNFTLLQEEMLFESQPGVYLKIKGNRATFLLGLSASQIQSSLSFGLDFLIRKRGVVLESRWLHLIQSGGF
jgi:hypothetical protein